MDNAIRKEPFRVLVVCGAPHVGKTTLIASLFDAVGGERIIDVIDMIQFQGQAARNIMQDGVITASVSNALVDACVIEQLSDVADMPPEKVAGSFLVIEGTYMKSARRAPLLQSIRTGLEYSGIADMGIDVEIIGVQVNGSAEMIRRYCPLPASLVGEIEPMSLDEGYDSLACVTNAPEDGERYIKITGRYSDFMVTDFHEPSDGAKAFVKSQSYDRIMRDDMLGYRRLAADPGWCRILIDSNSDGRS